MFRPAAARIALRGYNVRLTALQPRVTGVRNAAMYKKSQADGTAAEFKSNKKALGVGAGLVLLAGGTYYFIMSHPRDAVDVASKYDPRSRDDQHKHPANEADAARVAVHQSGAPLAKN